jgi:hypothetical protein
MINKYFLAFFLATALVGCGGSGEDLSSSMDGSGDGSSGGSGTTTCTNNQSAVGFWSGMVYKASSRNNKKPTVGVVLPSGKYFFATGDEYSSLISGSGSTNCSTFTSKDTFNPTEEIGLIQGTASGTVSTENTIKATFKQNEEAKGYADLDFESSYKYKPEISQIFKYRYTNIKVADHSFIFNGSNFRFLDSACLYQGSLTSQKDIGNSYELSLNISPYDDKKCDKSTTSGKSISGSAFIYTKNDVSYLILMGISDDKKWFSGAFKQTTP